MSKLRTVDGHRGASQNKPLSLDEITFDVLNDSLRDQSIACQP